LGVEKSIPEPKHFRSLVPRDEPIYA
jgi:hypothetical protein